MPYAKEIAKRYGAQLAVLHVRPPVVNPATPPETWASAEEAAGIQDEIRSKELGKEFAEFHADILLPEGDVQTLLPNLVEQKKIDLVVMGTRGHTGSREVLSRLDGRRDFPASPVPRADRRTARESNARNERWAAENSLRHRL